jgi:hypothetical protein
VLAALARPTASTGAACTTQLGQPAQRAVHGGSARGGGAARRRCCSASRRRCTGDDRGTGGSPARGQRRGAASMGERLQSGQRCGRRGSQGDGAVSEAVGATAMRARRGAVGAGARVGLSGHMARCPDSGLKVRARRVAHRSHAATARCHAGPARRASSDRWDPLSMISELKIIPKENSSKQIARK